MPSDLLLPPSPSDTLISPSGKILIPGIREAVAPLSDEEWKMYQDIQFDMEHYKNKIGVSQLMYSNKVTRSPSWIWVHKKVVVVTFLSLKVDLLAHMWRHPTVTIHGIEGGFSDPGTKTVIPAKVTAKFSIRQVPDMDPAMVKKQVRHGYDFSQLSILFHSFSFLNCPSSNLAVWCLR